jgi:hypothetical protein
MLVRFESPAAAELAEQAQALVGGEIVADDESLWSGHRELAAGLPTHRSLPADVPAALEELRGAGATRIVGRLARGILHTDAEKRGQTPIFHALEQRVVEAFGG